MRDCDLSVMALSDYRLFSGVIALESAGYYHGMNMYGITPVVIMSDTPNEIITSYIRHVPYVSDMRDDLTHLGGKLYVTNPERTVCELVIAAGNDEFIEQTIELYIAKYGTEETLLAYAEKYNCVPQMKQKIADMREYNY